MAIVLEHQYQPDAGIYVLGCIYQSMDKASNAQIVVGATDYGLSDYLVAGVLQRSVVCCTVGPLVLVCPSLSYVSFIIARYFRG